MHPLLTSRRSLALFAALMVLTLVVLMRHLLDGAVAFSGVDVVSAMTPHYTFVKETLAAGELPLWNPHVFSGRPELAGGQWGVFYPLQALVLPWVEVSTYIKLSLFFHLLLLAIASYLLAAELLLVTLGEDRRWAAALAGLAITFSGFTMGHLFAGHVTMIQALPYVVLTIWTGIKCANGRRWAGVAFACCCALILLAGGPQIMPMALLAGLPLWIVAIRAQPGRWRRPALRLALFLVLGLGLSAAQLLPMMELASLSLREVIDLSSRSALNSLSMSQLGGMLLPGWLEAIHSPLPWEFDGFLGAPVLALALVPLFDRRTRSAGGVLLGGAALLLFAGTTVGHAALVKVPGYDLLRVPARLLLCSTILLPLLAALGWCRAVEERTTGRPAAMVAGFAALVSLKLAWTTGRVEDYLVVGWAVVFALTIAVPWGRPALKVGLVLLASWIVLGYTAEDRFAGRPPSSADRLPERVTQRFVDEAPSYRVLTYHRRSWNHGMVHGYHNLGGYEPFAAYRSALLLKALSGEAPGGPWRRLFVVWPGSYDLGYSKLWDLYGVRLALAHATFEASAPLKVVARVEGLTLVENPRALPRAYFAPCAVAVKGPVQAFEALRSQPPDAGSLLVVEGVQPRSCRPAPGSAARGSVRFLADRPNRVVLESRSDVPGYVVLSDLNYPGWRAWIDGGPVPVLHANGAGRAVEVSRGAHRVEMRFEPGSFRNGLAITALAALLIAALTWLRRIWI